MDCLSKKGTVIKYEKDFALQLIFPKLYYLIFF